MTRDEELSDLPFFRDLAADEIRRFLHATGAGGKRYAKGDRILRAYEDNGSLGVIVEGRGQVLTEDRFGNESSSHLPAPPPPRPPPPATRRAPGIASRGPLPATRVLWGAWRALITAGTRLGRIHGIVMKNLLESFCRKNYLMTQKIEVLSQKTLRERIILYLLQREAQQETDEVTVPGRLQFARELSCNRSALTREVRAMEDDGLLVTGEGWMRLDHARLEEEHK